MSRQTLLLYRGKASLVRAHWSGPRRWLGLFFLVRACVPGFFRRHRIQAEPSGADLWTLGQDSPERRGVSTC